MAMLAWTWGGDGGVTHPPPPPYPGYPQPQKGEDGLGIGWALQQGMEEPLPQLCGPTDPLVPNSHVLSRVVPHPWFPLVPFIPYSSPHSL